MADIYDGIIIGGGHNALVLQAYLARSGLDILLIERRPVVGGGLCTMEDPAHPGFYHNTHSFFHRAITTMPWFQDLALTDHGVSYIEPALNVCMLTKDGRVLEWWTDFEKTVASFAQFSAKDAKALRRLHDEFVPIVKEILSVEAFAPPQPPEERHNRLTQTALGRRLLEVSALSPLEFVLKEFENPAIQAGLLFFNGLREVDLRAKGFGHHIASLLATPTKAQMARGGSAALARGLEAAVRVAGGKIRTSVTPSKLVIVNRGVRGVVTSEGEEIRARKFVVSSLNPHQTFLELIEERYLPRSIRQKAAAFKYNLIAPLFSLNLNLRAPPAYTAAKNNPQLAHAFMVIMGLDHVDQFTEIVRHHESGTIPPTVMWGACPTIFDPSQAPPGNHTAFMWEKLPYRLRGNAANWDQERDHHGRTMLSVWNKYAPNMEDVTLSSFTRSPLDVERCFPNMREGDLLIGAFTDGQVGYNRPFPGAGLYRGHLPGLYLCGSSSHPGGNITGIPGYNAAHVILSDLGIKVG